MWLKDNKSPGNDGFVSEFFKEFQEQLSEFMLCVFNEAIECGELPPSLCQGLISLIPKANKDTTLIDNWRPITLLNNDVKVFAIIFAERLKKCLEQIIDDCQSGFMKGRHISNNIRLVLDLIDYNEYIDSESFIFFVDFYKAFDTVSHKFLFETLDFFGFGNFFKRAIYTLYNGCNSSVKLMNGTTPRVFLERGIRQGCPISPFLFLLVTQTMTLYINKYNFHGIRILEREIKCCQLADDTTIFVRDSLEVKNVIDCLNKFSLVSGLKLNLNKCELFPLKNCQFIDINGIPVKNVVTYLGIKIYKDEKERGQLNFQSVLQKI